MHHAPFEKPDHHGPHHRFGVDAGLLHAPHVGKLKPFIRSITNMRRVTSVGWGRRITSIALSELGEHRGDVEHVLRLEAKVELLHDRFGEELDQRRGIGQRGDREAAHQMRGQPRHDGQVAPDEPSDGRTLHLDHDLGPIDQRRGVHLGDGRGGQGFTDRSWRTTLRRSIQLFLDYLVDDGPRLGLT